MVKYFIGLLVLAIVTEILGLSTYNSVDGILWKNMWIWLVITNLWLYICILKGWVNFKRFKKDKEGKENGK